MDALSYMKTFLTAIIIIRLTVALETYLPRGHDRFIVWPVHVHASQEDKIKSKALVCSKYSFPNMTSDLTNFDFQPSFTETMQRELKLADTLFAGTVDPRHIRTEQ